MASIFLNGGASGRSISRGGHSGPLIYGSRFMLYRYAISGKWGSTPTFASTDGNRCLAISRNARYGNVEQCTIGGNGYPPDNSPDGAAELMKFEGRDNCIGDSILYDSVQHGAYCDSGDWSPYMSGNRICHSVFQNFGGPVLEIRDYLDDGSPGNERVADMQIKNCIFDRMMQNEIPQWTDLLFYVVCSGSTDWRNVFSMHGVTIRDTRTSSQIYLSFLRGSDETTDTLANFIANEPANFSNITVTSSSLFTSERTLGTAIGPTDIATYYTPNTTANGVALTQANGSGSSSTTLVVDDSRWFVDPRYGTSPQIYIAGVGNRAYTALNKATHTFTLSASASWSDNAAVNRSITSGSTPNRGAVR